jgi:hypothetical protein
LLGDLGGIKEIFMIILGFFLFPVAEFQYILAAA